MKKINEQFLRDLKARLDLQKKFQKWKEKKERQRNTRYGVSKGRIKCWEKQFGKLENGKGFSLLNEYP